MSPLYWRNFQDNCASQVERLFHCTTVSCASFKDLCSSTAQQSWQFAEWDWTLTQVSQQLNFKIASIAQSHFFLRRNKHCHKSIHWNLFIHVSNLYASLAIVLSDPGEDDASSGDRCQQCHCALNRSNTNTLLEMPQQSKNKLQICLCALKHTHTHARTHARARARTHTQLHKNVFLQVGKQSCFGAHIYSVGSPKWEPTSVTPDDQ